MQILQPQDTKSGVFLNASYHNASKEIAAAVWCGVVPIVQVLEPKDGKVIYKDWDAMGSDISKLELFDDDEQPLPQNVSWTVGFILPCMHCLYRGRKATPAWKGGGCRVGG